MSRGSKPEVPDYLDVGDSVTVEHGKELYDFAGASFVVGGCSATTRVASGEVTGDAYARASAAARVMFEAEFESRLQEVKLRVSRVAAESERFEQRRSGK